MDRNENQSKNRYEFFKQMYVSPFFYFINVVCCMIIAHISDFFASYNVSELYLECTIKILNEVFCF